MMNTVIFGAGVVGTRMAQMLSERGHDVTVVDSNPKRIDKFESNTDVRCIIGEVPSHHVLSQSGCSSADLLLSVTNSDATNIVACKLAKKMGTKKVIARIREKKFIDGWIEQFESIFDIDLILNPEQLTAEEIAKKIGTTEYDVPSKLSCSNVAFQEWNIDESSPLCYQKIEDIQDFDQIIIPAIYRKNSIIIPTGKDSLEPDDRFFMVGDIGNIKPFFDRLQSETIQNRIIMIYGGGNIGFLLAKLLEKTKLSVKLIESNEKRCQFLSQHLHKTLILNGSCLDGDFLEEQNIQNVDVFIAITNDEEDNLIAALMAKEMGVKQSIVLSEKPKYNEIMKRLGVNTTVSPRLITANQLLQFFDPGPIKTLIILQENQAEVIEVKLSPQSKLVNKTIAKCKFPKGLIISSIIRKNDIIVPRGDVKLKANDIIIIFTLHTNIPFIQKHVT